MCIDLFCIQYYAMSIDHTNKIYLRIYITFLFHLTNLAVMGTLDFNTRVIFVLGKVYQMLLYL